MDNQTLCEKLLEADREETVVGILQDAGYWNNPSAWRPYGDIENNYGTIGNQQGEAIAALVEKIVNAVDARLTNECLARGENPESPASPQSIREAVHRYFGENRSFDPERDGRLSNWTDTRLNQEGGLITVAATGWRPRGTNNGPGNPCLTIADAGEGQTPDDFPETFLSLHKGNKIRIKFVQGKFNMGATGALPYCSEKHNFQLLVSRRNPALLKSGASKRALEWGFTIVRRRPPSEDSRSSVFEYLAPFSIGDSEHGGVLSFPAEEFRIFPGSQGAYQRTSKHGSLVKLYEYHWQGSKSSVIREGDGAGLIRRIEVAIPAPGLPIKLFESRPDYASNSPFRHIRGIFTAMERDSRDLEDGFPQGSELSVAGHHFKATVYAFKQGTYSSHRTARDGVLFIFNGQSHASYDTRFFRRHEVKKDYLARDLLVTVECSQVNPEAFEKLFMNSRDRLRSDSRIATDLVGQLESFLLNNEALRALEKERRDAAIISRFDKETLNEDLLKDLLDDDAELARFLLAGASLVQPGRGSQINHNGHFEGKQFPSFFEPIRPEWNVGVGKQAQVQFRTDAENNYFDRSLSPGKWNITDEQDHNWTAFWGRTGPVDGIVRFYWDTSVIPPTLLQPGAAFRLRVAVEDDSRVEPLGGEIQINIVEPVESPGGSGSRRRGGRGSVDPPRVIWIYEAEWEIQVSEPFTSKTAVRIMLDPSAPPGKNVWDFFVNVDNEQIHAFSRRKDQPIDVVRNLFSSAAVFLSLGLIRGVSQEGPHDRGNGRMNGHGLEGIEASDLVAAVTDYLAPVLLPVIQNLQIEENAPEPASALALGI